MSDDVKWGVQYRDGRIVECTSEAQAKKIVFEETRVCWTVTKVPGGTWR